MPMLPAGVRREDLEKLKAETNKIDWQRLAVEEEEEEEDLLGPVAPGQVTRGYVKASMAAEQRAQLDMLAKVEADEAAKLPKHEDWMSMVPEVKSLGFNLDDAQKNRTFLRREKADRGDISEWTAPPADKDDDEDDDAVVMLTAHPGAGATVGDAFLASSSSSSSSSSGRPRRQRAVVAVGPEGGWTDFERRSLLDAGFVEVALGRRTFATDVACVALVAAVRECTSSW